MKGSISDTYTVVPQYKGKYPIPSISFSYFDLKTESYKRLSSDEEKWAKDVLQRYFTLVGSTEIIDSARSAFFDAINKQENDELQSVPYAHKDIENLFAPSSLTNIGKMAVLDRMERKYDKKKG